MDMLSENKRAAIWSITLLLVSLFVWELSIPAQQVKTGELTEYELLTGAGTPKAGVPPPSKVIIKAWEELSNPFYDAGPNDKGIGIQEFPTKEGCDHSGCKVLAPACYILRAMTGIYHLTHLFQYRKKGFCLHSQIREDGGVPEGYLLELVLASESLLDHSVTCIQHVGDLLVRVGTLARSRNNNYLTPRIRIDDLLNLPYLLGFSY
jgi:hypothetical protein